ncbi:retrovirus-related pol polyprotein from transposon 17.6 [Tanacetum coccineum]
MPFSLTNAPSTFQALMNDVFREYLRKFSLIFFDNILIYSQSLEDHVHHLAAVLSKMKERSLYAKESKCVFGTTNVEYLGHVISSAGVSTDPTKIQAMQNWHVPTTLNRPLTQLLKKNSFKWNNEARQAFILLKEAMIQALVLALPNFQKPFIVETDAS